MRPLAALFLVPASLCSMVACEPPRASAHIEAPPVSIDVDARRADLEHALCQTGPHDGSDGCKVLRALDASDDGAVSVPPHLPEYLPRTIEIDDKRAHREVARWLAGLDDIVPELRLPVGGVVDADLLQGAELLDARLGVTDDTLTFALPALSIAVAYDGNEHKVAIVEEGARDGAPIHFANNGVRRLLDAATYEDGEVILRADDIALEEGPEDTLVTPGGSVGLRVELTVSGDVPL